MSIPCQIRDIGTTQATHTAVTCVVIVEPIVALGNGVKSREERI